MIRSPLLVPVALVLLAVPSSVAGQQPLREVVVPAGATVGQNFSPAIRTGNLLFVTGQAAGGADVSAQTTATMESIKRIVEAGGTTMANVVKCTVFLVDIADYAAMNDAYRVYFPEGQRPARSTFQVVRLVGPNARVEIECIAVVPDGR